MVAKQPENRTWQLETVYASTNLGRVEYAQAHYPEAAQTFQASVAAIEPFIAAEPGNPEYLNLMLEALGDRADALGGAGQLDDAIGQREQQLRLLAPYLALDRPDAQLRQKAMIAHMALAWMRFVKGDTKVALDEAATAVDIGNQLISLEPANKDWLSRGASTQINHAMLLLRSGRALEAGAVAVEGCNRSDSLIARDPTVIAWRDLARLCLQLRAELALGDGGGADAVRLARQTLDDIRSDKILIAKDRFALSQGYKLVGDMMWRGGDRAGARAAWQSGLAAWPKGVTETPRQMAERGEMLRGIGQRAEGMGIGSQLAAMGYRQSLSNRARV
jgi:tetratricopeptide (TPR) repeat protein